MCLTALNEGAPCTSDSDCTGFGATCSVFKVEQTVNNSPKVNFFGGNVRLTDMNGDNLRDVVLSDVDVAEPGCERQLALLRTDVLCEGGTNDGLPCTLDTDCPGGTCSDVTISDPLGSDERDWNTLGTYDTAVFDVNGDGKPDLWSGTCSGNRLFIQGSTSFVVVSPPDCTLDARVPHPIDDNSLAVRQGIGSPNTYTGGPEPITIDLGLTGSALLACWDLSETDIEEVQQGTPALDPNRIQSVTEGSPGVYDILLERPISAGQWTTITYLGDVSGSSAVSYASLPADSNADGLAHEGMEGDPDSDVWRWVYCCFQQQPCEDPPADDYTCDINHDVSSWNFMDLGRIADLLQGFGTYIVWEGKTLPSNSCLGGESMMSGGTLAGAAELENPSDRFLTYLTTTTVPPGRSKEDLFMVIRVLTTLYANSLPMDEKVTLAERLQDPTLTFQTKFVADMIPDIATELRK